MCLAPELVCRPFSNQSATAHGPTCQRPAFVVPLLRALDEFVVDGIETTLPLFRKLVRTQDIIDGNYHIHWLERFLAEGGMEP